VIAPDRQLVRRLRDRVRAAVAGHAPWREERRRTRVRWLRRQRDWRVLRFLVPTGILIAGACGMTVATISFLLVLWTVLVTLNRAQLVANTLHASPELLVFFQLPVGNAAVFHHQARRVFLGSLWLGADWLALGLVMAARDGGAAAWLAAPVTAIAQWVVTLACAVALAWRLPHFPFGSMAWAAWVLASILDNVDSFKAWLGPLRRAFETYSPAGWLARMGQGAAAGEILPWLALVAAPVGAWFILRHGFHALRARFNPERALGYDTTDPDQLQWTRAEPHDPAHAADAQFAAATSSAAARSADDPDDASAPPVDLPALRTALAIELDQPPGLALFRRGWVEQLIARRLTLRQRVIVDCLQPNGFRAGRGWLIALGAVVLARLLLAAGWQGATPAVIAGVATAIFAVPLFGGMWAGLGAASSGPVSIGWHSLVPLGFREIAGTRLAVSAWRTVLALPVLVVAAAFGFTAAPLPWDEAVRWAVRAGVAVLAVQPFWIVVGFSANTNDTSSRWWFTALSLIALLFGLVVIALSFVYLATNPPLGYEFLAAVALLAYTHGCLALYGVAYNRRVFDLIARPTPGVG
jgi:hypothetical protein